MWSCTQGEVLIQYSLQSWCVYLPEGSLRIIIRILELSVCDTVWKSQGVCFVECLLRVENYKGPLNLDSYVAEHFQLQRDFYIFPYEAQLLSHCPFSQFLGMIQACRNTVRVANKGAPSFRIVCVTRSEHSLFTCFGKLISDCSFPVWKLCRLIIYSHFIETLHSWKDWAGNKTRGRVAIII